MRPAVPLVTPVVGAVVVALAFCANSFAQKQDSVGAGAATAAKEETVVLSPFAVIADPSDSYQALNTSSLTGTNRSLEKLPITIIRQHQSPPLQRPLSRDWVLVHTGSQTHCTRALARGVHGPWRRLFHVFEELTLGC